jgi:hypothetical protein
VFIKSAETSAFRKGEKMNKKLLVGLIALATLAILVSTVKAQITCTIVVKDKNGNALGGTVPVNTVAYAYGHYEDLAGSAPAQAWMEVYYDSGTGLVYETTIYAGTVLDGQTVQGTPYTLSKLGTYEFRFTCQAGGTTGMLQCGERAQARTTIQLSAPEPGTIAALLMALSALGFLAYRKTRAK